MSKNNAPVISVLMPVYNCELYVEAAVNSILNQTFGDFELIIIDDCSTDSTPEIIKQYNDQRINFIVKPKNTGYTDSLNHGISIAKGKYIARMDGDDISLTERFERQVEFMEGNPQVICCGTGYREISGNLEMHHPIKHEDIVLKIIDHCPMAHPTIMIRKDVLDTNNIRYDRTYEPAEDYKMWSDLVFFGQFANLDQVLLLYRVHQSQTSNKRKDEQVSNSIVIQNAFLRKLGVETEQITTLLTPKIGNIVQLKKYKTAETTFFRLVKEKLWVNIAEKKLKERRVRFILNTFHETNFSIKKAFELSNILLRERIQVNALLYLKFIIKSIIHYKN